ncbi:glutathione synthetase ATP-binding domain-like protein [Aspergillus campestris IBT 28561]|uniref:Glutathione synthetase ATP-binding domain-like protein n=1 Tax=Aspergillus campestris (strain IBT 28561) TaxID=1392248 RepID=A0A2I1CVZ1_ASPC2|nr:glutathione synthetase ATP-binding domain-like protein [Aspergillus campestris IBT 28561]PKY01778.1 glutathione synthetase ATP-binding domain-like protein [Aspergillus campestris IBT 28561]
MPALTIALVAERRSTYLADGRSQQECAALTHDGEVDEVVAALKRLGHTVVQLPGITSLVQSLATNRNKEWDLVFNMSQGFYGSAREAQVPALLDAYQIPYTFADAATMALCQNKINTKTVLDHCGVPNAAFSVISPHQRNIDDLVQDSKHLAFPLFVKLGTEGSSKGIDSFNKVNSTAELTKAVENLRSDFPDQPILVESFLAGREFTVSLLGTGELSRVIGVREHIWQDPSKTSHDGLTNGDSAQDFSSWQSKSSTDCGLVVKDYKLSETIDPQVQTACLLALDAWTLLGCRDAGRVDIRFDSNEPGATAQIMEVNPISGMLPGHSPLPASAQINGISFEQLMAGIIESTLLRISRKPLTNMGSGPCISA